MTPDAEALPLTAAQGSVLSPAAYAETLRDIRHRALRDTCGAGPRLKKPSRAELDRKLYDLRNDRDWLLGRVTQLSEAVPAERPSDGLRAAALEEAAKRCDHLANNCEKTAAAAASQARMDDARAAKAQMIVLRGAAADIRALAALPGAPQEQGWGTAVLEQIAKDSASSPPPVVSGDELLAKVLSRIKIVQRDLGVIWHTVMRDGRPRGGLVGDEVENVAQATLAAQEMLGFTRGEIERVERGGAQP